MAQISRPFQIALLAVVLLAGVWLFALRGSPSTSSSGSGSVPPASQAPSSTPQPSAPASSPSSPSAPSSSSGSIYHGSAPGVEGLSRAIATAHEAVSTSQQNAHQLEQRSAEASSTAAGAAASHAAPAPTTSAATPAPAASKPATVKSVPRTAAKPAPVTRSKVAPQARTVRPAAPAKQVPSRQKRIEAALAAGDVVLLLFWDRSGADDVAVHNAVLAAARGQRKVVVSQATSHEVASYGTITRGVQVYGTPTLLVVGKRGSTIVLTGLTDSYSIAQAIGEARAG